MTVEQLIEELKKQPPGATVWVDWDREGGNENEVSKIEDFHAGENGPAIALR